MIVVGAGAGVVDLRNLMDAGVCIDAYIVGKLSTYSKVWCTEVGVCKTQNVKGCTMIPYEYE